MDKITSIAYHLSILWALHGIHCEHKHSRFILANNYYNIIANTVGDGQILWLSQMQLAGQLMIFTEAVLSQQFTQHKLLYIVANQNSHMCTSFRRFVFTMHAVPIQKLNTLRADLLLVELL